MESIGCLDMNLVEKHKKHMKNMHHIATQIKLFYYEVTEKGKHFHNDFAAKSGRVGMQKHSIKYSNMNACRPNLEL